MTRFPMFSSKIQYNKELSLTWPNNEVKIKIFDHPWQGGITPSARFNYPTRWKHTQNLIWLHGSKW